MSLKTFDFETPQTVGEHAEISHLLSFVEECVEPVIRGEKTLSDLDRDLAIAKYELESCLRDCLNHWKATQNKTL